MAFNSELKKILPEKTRSSPALLGMGQGGFDSSRLNCLGLSAFFSHWRGEPKKFKNARGFTMTYSEARDAEGFYELPTDISTLISLLLPRLSDQKINLLRTELGDRPARNLTIDQLPFLTVRESTVILAAIELGRVSWSAPTARMAVLDSPGASYKVFSEILRGKVSEHFVVLFLDIKNRLMDKSVISIGTWTETLVPIPEILRLAINKRSPRIIVAHNHPSGSLEPSREDYLVTEALIKACKTVKIAILDHLVITDNGYISLRQTDGLPSNVRWEDS
jgi:DNA repair protein RadC